MSLRYRLFLWVSGLFVVVAVCSYFVENYVANKELKIAQQQLKKKILGVSEKRREELQDFLAIAIAEDEVKIDAILNNIASFSPMALRFSPTAKNEKTGTWGDASDILVEYKWLDFIQNTNEGKPTAGIMPKHSGMGAFFRIPIDEDLSWVYDESLEDNSIPYLGVRVPYSLIRYSSQDATAEVLEHIPGLVPDLFFLFDVNKLMKQGPERIFDRSAKAIPPIPIQWTEGYELDPALFVTAFQRGQDLIVSGKMQPPQHSQDELKAMYEKAATAQDGTLNPVPDQNLLNSVFNEKFVKARFEDIALRYTQVNILWIMVALFDSGIFGDDLFAYPFPGAATVFGDSNALGAGINTKDIFFGKRVFDDSAYYKNNVSKDPHSNLATSLAVITTPDSNRLFFGNTAQFTIHNAGAARTGYLTFGVDSDALLQRLVLAIRQTAVLVHDGKPLLAYNDKGEKLGLERSADFPVDKMMTKTSGMVAWEGENYFFMHVQPFPDVDLHFFIFNPESKEFALLHDLESGSREVVDTIRLNTHIEGLIALLITIVLIHTISRRVTKPIIQLAAATKDVAEGHYDQAKLSLPPIRHNDEIAVLCHSFNDMVNGLQEKEKVKGVLNKVVSTEIAQEILKGSIHLGGEVKTVSVLFADIREFTRITQDMPPQKVIDLLNTCMTKVSKIVDRNKGVIDKYVGDAAMALYGAPLTRSEDAFDAIKSALEMVAALKEWNQERSQMGKVVIELGIGIHTGPVLAGNMGAENRLNYTVIGSNVNLASRLCKAAKGMEILITKDTLDQPLVRERVVYEETPPQQFKGFDKLVNVYRVLRIKNET